MGRRGRGEGTIAKRMKGDRVAGYKAAVTVGRKPNGQLDRRWLSGKTREEVVRKKMAIEAQVQSGLISPGDPTTLDTWLTRWLEIVQSHGVAQNTLRSYHDIARLHLRPHLGRKLLDRLQPSDVQFLMLAMQRDGKSRASMRYALRILRMALRAAVENQLIPRNVAQAVRSPKADSPEMLYWRPDEVTRFMEVARTHRLGVLFQVALSTGLRKGELLGLSWNDITWEQSRLSVRQNYTEVRRDSEGRVYRSRQTVSRTTAELTQPKTRRSRRTIGLAQATLEALRLHQVVQQAEAEGLGHRWSPTDPIFTTEIGTRVHPRNLSHDHKRLSEEAGVLRIRFHDLRHTAASLMILRGIPVQVVSERLGHTDVAFTMRVYAHLYDEQRDEAVFDVGDLVGTGSTAGDP